MHFGSVRAPRRAHVMRFELMHSVRVHRELRHVIANLGEVVDDDEVEEMMSANEGVRAELASLVASSTAVWGHARLLNGPARFILSRFALCAHPLCLASRGEWPNSNFASR